jgi:transposase
VLAGQSCRPVAKTFGVSVASVVKWTQRFRATGKAAAKPIGRRRPFALAGDREWVLACVTGKPDITLRVLAAELGERGIKVSNYAVWNFLRRQGRSLKKLCTPASRIGPTWQGGGHSGKSIKAGLIRPVVFIDETWARTNMTRSHGRCAKGQRLIANVPQGGAGEP